MVGENFDVRSCDSVDPAFFYIRATLFTSVYEPKQRAEQMNMLHLLYKAEVHAALSYATHELKYKRPSLSV
jgi:hypothetical protein